MFHNTHPIRTLLLLAAAALFVTALPGTAAAHGGGGGGHGGFGGGHGGFGGFHGGFGAYHHASYGGGIGYPYHGYYHPYTYNNSYGNYYPSYYGAYPWYNYGGAYPSYSFGAFPSYGGAYQNYSHYYPSYYGAYPWYDYGDHPYSYGGASPLYSSQPYSDWGYFAGQNNSATYSGLTGGSVTAAPQRTYNAAPDQAQTYSGLSGSVVSQGWVAAAAPPPDNTAHISVKLPPDAQLWFDGKKTKLTGPQRKFATPDLTAGHSYHYDVRARWKEKGHEVTQTLTIEVSPGARVPVQFPLPTTAQAVTREKTSP
jgi:uncharacterized protein (TIGR03000 family)